MKYIVQYIIILNKRRKNKFFEYYFLEKDIDLNELKLQKDEVEKVAYTTLEEYENNISNAINFQMFKNFYLNIYLEENKKKMK